MLNRLGSSLDRIIRILFRLTISIYEPWTWAVDLLADFKVPVSHPNGCHYYQHTRDTGFLQDGYIRRAAAPQGWRTGQCHLVP